jgi:protein-L-isoaspartate(D-aspartate) O-methyltransferase
MKQIQRQKEILLRELRELGIRDEEVLRAIKKVPRELFVLDEYQIDAYADIALPIEHRQTISQPYVVARMTEALHLSGTMDKVLEIGTGSGYQAAILAELAKEVYGVERIRALYEQAKKRLQKLKIKNVKLHYGDGYLGWEEHASYDAIIVTAATLIIPETLMEQLKVGGRMVIPVGELFNQQLLLIIKTSRGIERQMLDPVRFVPLLPGVE